MYKKRYVIIFFSLFLLNTIYSQNCIALLKYNGGGDWYANPTSLPNLSKFCNQNLGTNLCLQSPTVEVGSIEIFNYPMVHVPGHGNIIFSDQEAKNLRNYLISGGFLHADDNYGLDKFFRKEMQKVFPELSFVSIPNNHPIFNQKYKFPNGLPKIHSHDNKPAEGLGLFWKGRLVCFYSYESDLGDGWEDLEVHKDTPDVREKALKMGANIIQFVFNQ
jgi:hypothetical protein